MTKPLPSPGDVVLVRNDIFWDPVWTVAQVVKAGPTFWTIERPEALTLGDGDRNARRVKIAAWLPLKGDPVRARKQLDLLRHERVEAKARADAVYLQAVRALSEGE